MGKRKKDTNHTGGMGTGGAEREAGLSGKTPRTRVVAFEMSQTRLMKVDENRHDFTGAQFACSLPLPVAGLHEVLLPLRGTRLPTIIYIAK